MCELNIDVRVVWDAFADIEQHLPRDVILATCRKGASECDPIFSALTVERRGTPERPHSPGRVSSAFFTDGQVVPRRRIARTQRAVCSSRCAGEEKSNDNDDAQHQQPDDFTMNESRFSIEGVPLTGAANEPAAVVMRV
jgi:hypothetical protein